MQAEQIEIASVTEVGKIGILYLKHFWSIKKAIRNGLQSQIKVESNWRVDTLLFTALGLGVEQVVKYVYMENPTFEEFEDWILQLNGNQISKENIEIFNAIIKGEPVSLQSGISDDVLTNQDLEFFNTNGYVIVRNAVSKQDCEAAVAAICNFIGADLNNPETWYTVHQAKQKIMVQLFQHPDLEKNRNSPKIRRAYEQIFGHGNILRNTDRAGFNPPETVKHPFQGPDLHWDVSLNLPIPFGLQGILYLTDTAENQGAFTLVPGFQHKIESWINSLPTQAKPHTQNLHALGSKPIAANAGDFIIWHQALPHGSSANTATMPRIVQYINYVAVDFEYSEIWQ